MVPIAARARFVVPLVLLVLIAPLVLGDQLPVKEANYKQALKYSSDYLRQHTYDTAVTPHWIGKTDAFWYSYRTSKGVQWYRVDPKLRLKEPLFDRIKLATQLSEMIQKPLDPNQLPLTRTTINDEGTKIKFVVGEFQYEYDLNNDKLVKLGKAPPLPQGFPGKPGFGGKREISGDEEILDDETPDDDKKDEEKKDEEKKDDMDQKNETKPGGKPRPGDYRNISPDKKSLVFALKHNLYFAEVGKENEAIPLTKDGVEDYSFGGSNEDRKARAMAVWSSDSKSFYVLRGDSRGVQELYLVNSLAVPRPALEKYKYAMPGEEKVRKSELHVFDRDSKKLTRIPTKWKDEDFSNLHFGKTGEELRFIRRDRLRRHLEVCSANTITGEAKCLVNEGFDAAYLDFQPVRYLDETNEMIWWSERSGWGHFYLYDRDGKLKNAITSGDFRASQVVAVDAKNRMLYFQGNGREQGENVYFQHLYRVRLDGTGLTLLDPGNANHFSTMSPSRQFVVVNSTRVDCQPCSFVTDGDGDVVMKLESADLSKLYEAGWKMPETFTVKAADGVTDLYGNLWKPFDFDPKKKYPIIAHVYPGPQQEGVTHTFSAISTNQQLAQLGFIVIQVGHRGGAPTRSKAYHSYSYFNMRDYGLADKKSAIEQLAARHPFIDVERVGIFGHSGGGFMSAAAVLQKPYNEFFKAGVASAGNHDNNVYNNSWAERYHGLKEVPIPKEVIKPPKLEDKTKVEDKTKISSPGAEDVEKKDVKTVKTGPDTKFEIKVPTNAELAANLKGHLLLVHGDMDNNVHYAGTMRLVDALIKANKRFDMLIIPGKRHGFGDAQPYFTQKMWDFFVEHLIGVRQTSADIGEKKEK